MKLDERPVIPLEPEAMRRKVSDLIRILNQTVNAMQAGGPGATYTATTAPPTLGSYAAGTVVLNSSPTELGIAPNTYVVYGWICTASGSPGTWEAMNVPSGVFGGSGASWGEAEIDFGAQPVYSAEFTITDAGITATSKVTVLPSGKPATGRTADDWAWDGATFAANPGTGSATCYAVFTPGPIVGKRKIQYTIGA